MAGVRFLSDRRAPPSQVILSAGADCVGVPVDLFEGSPPSHLSQKNYLEGVGYLECECQVCTNHPLHVSSFSCTFIFTPTAASRPFLLLLTRSSHVQECLFGAFLYTYACI